MKKLLRLILALLCLPAALAEDPPPVNDSDLVGLWYVECYIAEDGTRLDPVASSHYTYLDLRADCTWEYQDETNEDTIIREGTWSTSVYFVGGRVEKPTGALNMAGDLPMAAFDWVDGQLLVLGVPEVTDLFGLPPVPDMLMTKADPFSSPVNPAATLGDLQGRWVIYAMEQDGRRFLPAVIEYDARLTIAGDAFTLELSSYGVPSTYCYTVSGAAGAFALNGESGAFHDPALLEDGTLMLMQRTKNIGSIPLYFLREDAAHVADFRFGVCRRRVTVPAVGLF